MLQKHRSNNKGFMLRIDVKTLREGGLNAEQQAFMIGYQTAINTLKNVYARADDMTDKDKDKEVLARMIPILEHCLSKMPKNYEMLDQLKEFYEDGTLVRGVGDDDIVQ